MIKVKIIKTGEVVEVTNNIAHGLLERGEAKIFKEYEDKMLKPEASKKYRIK